MSTKRSRSRARSKSRARSRGWRIKKKKSRTPCTTQCSHCRFFNKFLINATDYKSALYKAFKNMKTIRFLQEFEFVNCKFSIRGANVSCVIRGFKTKPSWEEIKWSCVKCKNHSSNLKPSPCSVGSKKNKKIFFRKAKDLKSYIQGIKDGKISLAEHSELFKTSISLLGRRFINSNREVGILHFKQR